MNTKKTALSAQKRQEQQKKLEAFVSQYSLPKEEWREVAGTNGRYYVSNKGRVLSLCRTKAKVLKPYLRGGKAGSIGYQTVYICGKNKRVHRLVAIAFIGNPPDGCIVHHKDGNKQNNVLENLAYITYSENAKEYYKSKRAKAEEAKEAGKTE